MEKKQRNLNAAAKAKKDEFYTQLTDIEKEMRYYRKHFRILCIEFQSPWFDQTNCNMLFHIAYYGKPVTLSF